DLKLTGEKCEMRDIPEYVCNKMPYSKDEVESIVKFDKSVKWRIIDDFGVEALKFNEEGNILININWSDIKSFYNYILTFGDKAEIISPEEYRQEFMNILKNTSKNYVL
ncbi:MAG: WYL domain-containing protein, partial [Ruminococcus sp.]|nr:WYL domain-containing protein [Ruminococcus sp.]